jgi:hypothetical protein
LEKVILSRNFPFPQSYYRWDCTPTPSRGVAVLSLELISVTALGNQLFTEIIREDAVIGWALTRYDCVLIQTGQHRKTDAKENLRVVTEAQTGAVQLQAQDADPDGRQRLRRGEASRVPEGEGPWDRGFSFSLQDCGRVAVSMLSPQFTVLFFAVPDRIPPFAFYFHSSVHEMSPDGMPTLLCGLLL